MHKIQEVLEKHKGNDFLKVMLYVSGKVRLRNGASYSHSPFARLYWQACEIPRKNLPRSIWILEGVSQLWEVSEQMIGKCSRKELCSNPFFVCILRKWHLELTHSEYYSKNVTKYCDEIRLINQSLILVGLHCIWADRSCKDGNLASTV